MFFYIVFCFFRFWLIVFCFCFIRFRSFLRYGISFYFVYIFVISVFIKRFKLNNLSVSFVFVRILIDNSFFFNESFFFMFLLFKKIWEFLIKRKVFKKKKKIYVEFFFIFWDDEILNNFDFGL